MTTSERPNAVPGPAPGLLHRRNWQRIGTRAPLILGVALMAAAVLLDRAWLAPWRERVRLAEAQALARPAATRSAPRWPTAAQAAERTAQLLLRAQREGLRVQRSRERLEAQNASHVFEMQAQGGYGDLRRFLAHALADDPALALESLQVQRTLPSEGRSASTGQPDKASDAGRRQTLRVELRWRLLHQPAGARS